MAILLNQILNLSEDEIQNSKIEFNMTEGSGGDSYIDIWLEHSDKDKSAGKCFECSYWGWYGNKRNFYPGNIVFSFIRLETNEWLLISVAEIIDVPENSRASVKICKKYASLFGRLIIQCEKGNTFSRYVFNLSNYLDNAVVKEILPCLYSGDTFEGYDNVNLPYRKLDDIFKGKILPSYYEALQKVLGVYCLTDTNTGKLYIGSATGSRGVAQRWGNYLDSKHGGNAKLIKKKKKKGAEYFEKYFTFTLLEYFSLSYDPEKIKEREQYWKHCLNTIEHGYNDN